MVTNSCVHHSVGSFIEQLNEVDERILVWTSVKTISDFYQHMRLIDTTRRLKKSFSTEIDAKEIVQRARQTNVEQIVYYLVTTLLNTVRLFY